MISVMEMTTNRGTRMLVVNGYRFYKSVTCKSSQTRWYCSKRSRTKCAAYLLIMNGEIINYSFYHNHADKNVTIG